LGKIEIVRILVAAGADASVVGTDGFTPLHQAVTVQGGRSQDDEKSEIVSLLLAGGAETEAVWVENGHPATPLGVAISNGFCVSAGLLLEAGANQPLGSLGLRPVHLAAYKGYPRCLEHLIEHGADVNAPSPNGKAYGTLYMAARGVQDLLHKKYGKPPPPENALRRWLFTLVSSKPDDDAMKKRWCPVFEVLFRAGAEVRPDWRDDPFAGVAEDFRGPICGFTKGSGEL